MRLNLKGDWFYLLMCKPSYKKLELEKSVRTSLKIVYIIYYFDEVVQAVSSIG